MNTFLFVLSLISAVSCQNPIPSFSWQQGPPHQVPLLRIRFPDGDKDDFAILKTFNPIPLGANERAEDVDSCIYDGYLQNESNVYVTVTGCANSDTFQVQFRSQRLNGHMFKVVGGEVEEVPSIFGQKVFNRDGSFTVISDASLKIPNRSNSMVVPTGRALNPTGYLLRIKVRYDENFKAKFGADSVNVARRVLAQAQNIWKWKDSLTTTVTFQIDPNVEAIRGRFVAEDDLEVASTFSKADVDANVVLAFRNNQPGTVGIAWGGSVCDRDPKWRTSLNEYFVDDLRSGQTVAHEIGHNLGMEHDFNDDPRNKRVDSKGRPCSGVGGVMDYYGTVNKWSTCSVEDFTKLVDSMKTFCLKKL